MTELEKAAVVWAENRAAHRNAVIAFSDIHDAFEAGARWAIERAASVAFEKVRCDDRTDRWQIANEVAAHIRNLAWEDEGK